MGISKQYNKKALYQSWTKKIQKLNPQAWRTVAILRCPPQSSAKSCRQAGPREATPGKWGEQGACLPPLGQAFPVPLAAWVQPLVDNTEKVWGAGTAEVTREAGQGGKGVPPPAFPSFGGSQEVFPASLGHCCAGSRVWGLSLGSLQPGSHLAPDPSSQPSVSEGASWSQRPRAGGGSVTGRRDQASGISCGSAFSHRRDVGQIARG